MNKRHLQGSRASRLRQGKFETLRRPNRIPRNALLGSLSVRQTHCGKPNCRCTTGERHQAWSLTFMVDGRKRVLHIPKSWVEQVRRRVDEGREFKEAVAQVFAANAELLALELRKRSR